MLVHFCSSKDSSICSMYLYSTLRFLRHPFHHDISELKYVIALLLRSSLFQFALETLYHLLVFYSSLCFTVSEAHTYSGKVNISILRSQSCVLMRSLFILCLTSFIPFSLSHCIQHCRTISNLGSSSTFVFSHLYSSFPFQEF